MQVNIVKDLDAKAAANQYINITFAPSVTAESLIDAEREADAEVHGSVHGTAADGGTGAGCVSGAIQNQPESRTY